MPHGDAIRALDHPYRQSILKVLGKRGTTYSDLFSHLEPTGGDRGRFNYHLRSLRNADLIWLTDGHYRLTPRGQAALVLLNEVSNSEARPRSKKESRAVVQGWVRRVGDALRSRAAELNAIVPVWRVLLLVGSVLLLVSYFLPWFTVSYPVLGMGHQDLYTRTYYGLDGIGTLPLAFFGGGLSGTLASLWLFLVVVFGVASALGARKFSWFGISGILLLALSAIQIFVAANLGGISITTGTPSVGFAYGFILAVIGCASIETGARLKTPAAQVAPMKTPLPLGILLIGLGVASFVGGFFALPPIGVRLLALASPITGILLMVLGIASTVGGIFALTSPTRAPPSPGAILAVLGTVSAVSGLLAFMYVVGYASFERYPHFVLVRSTITFGVTMLAVGIVLRVRPSIGSRPARPAASPLREKSPGDRARRQRRRKDLYSRRRASLQFRDPFRIGGFATTAFPTQAEHRSGFLGLHP